MSILLLLWCDTDVRWYHVDGDDIGDLLLLRGILRYGDALTFLLFGTIILIW